MSIALLSFSGTWNVTSNGLANDQETAKRQITRKKLMKEFCATHAYKTQLTKSDLEFIVVDDVHKIIYCTIPKVGTTTWKRILADLRGLGNDVRIHRWNLWRRFYEYTEEEKSQRLQTYFKFLFVREPLARLVSAFKDKFVGWDLAVSKRARASMVKAYRPQDFNPDDNRVNFSEFVQYFSQKMSKEISTGNNTNSSAIHAL
ncbi:Carbohydrate (chondroitin 4) sulfotransferase 13 [Desmophyllum pertusum]|uniref:Carbohydrate sulfotransferase n=1 Tax=Desmophyllum pertusum TaxID=174260 RepID=A0A9W9ZPS1_9CNID|nr:Carbohydrate (chondroitin 4) sulfotransferase 13 [Desmophyllum pertusum]